MKRDHEIVYEDDNIVVVNKAAGLLTIPDRYQHDKRNLSSLMIDRYGEIFVVHRIDRETSGLIMFAKDADTHKSLSEAFEENKIDKTYLAIVQGCPRPAENRIETFLVKSETERSKIIVFKKGKWSVTDYKVLENYDNKYSLVEVKILTGRTHQIRVHMKHIGNPLLVDSKYSDKEEFKLSEIKKRKFRLQKDEIERPLISRHSLHAMKLGFEHPATGERMDFEVPLPKDMKAVVNQMRKVVGVVS